VQANGELDTQSLTYLFEVSIADAPAVFPSVVEPLIDANSAAAILHVHPVTAREMAAAGEIPSLKLGRCWRFRASALNEWINSHMQGGTRKKLRDTVHRRER